MSETERLKAEGIAQLERIQRLNKDQALERLKAMDPIVFEHLTAALFERRGFTARTTGGTGDEGVDIFASKGTQMAIVQCKRYDNSVGQPTVRDLYGTMIHNHADEAYLVTTAMLTRQAQEWATGKPIHLIDGFTLVNWIMAAKPASSPSQFRPSTPAAYTVQEERRRKRSWLWPAAVVFFIIFGFAVGIAYAFISGRLTTNGTEPPAIPATTVADTPTAVVVVAPTTTETTTPESTEPSQDGSPTPEMTPTWTPVAATIPPACSVPVDGQFTVLYDRSALGCPTGGAAIVWSAWEPFERGAMLWRSDTDTAYAFYNQNARWFEIEERWDGKPIPTRGNAPPGLHAPLRGFGYVWGIRDDIFQELGWATDIEKGFCAAVQTFEQGFILKSVAVPSCTSEGLYNQANASDWQPVILIASNNGRWSNSNPEAMKSKDDVVADVAQSPSNAFDQRIPPGARPRPDQQGRFTASATGALVLDGNLSDWSQGWTPVGALVQGVSEYAGQADLSGEFQALWSQDGLYVAVRVRDDQHRSGPDGTDMWKGDGLELHFDRLIEADYTGTKADDDDYQIGISYGPNRNQIRVYRWLPYPKEGSFSIPGVVTDTAVGYQVEVLIPWFIFDVQGNTLVADTVFGFNLSINDNDGDSVAQQSVLSASPARTTYDNPTEWGTLILGR